MRAESEVRATKGVNKKAVHRSRANAAEPQRADRTKRVGATGGATTRFPGRPRRLVCRCGPQRQKTKLKNKKMDDEPVIKAI